MLECELPRAISDDAGAGAAGGEEVLVSWAWAESATAEMPLSSELLLSESRVTRFAASPRPRVLRVQPAAGLSLGGFEVEVHGEGFLPKAQLTCRFGAVGGAASVPAAFVSSALVRCIAPAHVPGSVPLEVSNNGLEFSDGGHTVEFVTGLEVDALWPTSGPSHGGTWVALIGRGFTAADGVEVPGSAVCRFGGV